MKKVFTLLLTVSAIYTNGQMPANSNDSSRIYQLEKVDITARWKNDTERYHYNQMKYYVTTILPYLNTATKLFKEINTKTEEQDISRKERRQFINSKEQEVRDQFEDKIKGLNVTQ